MDNDLGDMGGTIFGTEGRPESTRPAINYVELRAEAANLPAQAEQDRAVRATQPCPVAIGDKVRNFHYEGIVSEVLWPDLDIVKLDVPMHFPGSVSAIASELTRIIKIGTVAGRHPLPVDTYLVNEIEPGQAAYDACYEAARNYPLTGRIEIELFYTGLTEATLGALDGMRKAIQEAEEAGHAVKLTVWRYDSGAQEYVKLFRQD